MTTLERRYRRLLRMLPADYRAAWEEEMVTTFLAGMQSGDPERDEYLADFGRPSVAEAASVVALAIRLRLPAARLPRAPSRHDVVRGDAVRLAALSAMLVHASSVGGTILTGLWLTGRTPWLSQPPPEADFVLHDTWFHAAGLAAVVWLPAYLALVTGQRRIARVLVLVTVTASAAALAANPLQPFNASALSLVVFDVLTFLALVGFHREVPPIPHRPWLIALVIALIVNGGLATLTIATGMKALPLVDGSAAYCAAMVVAGAVVLVRRPGPAWTVAMAMLAWLVTGMRALTAADYAQFAPPAQRSTLLILGIGEAFAVCVLAAVLTAVAARTSRRQPNPA